MYQSFNNNNARFTYVKKYQIVPHCFYQDAKRLIGRRFDDTVVQSDMKYWPFKVVSDGGKPKVEVEYKGETKTFYPEEVSSMVLTKMKEISEAYLGKVR